MEKQVIVSEDSWNSNLYEISVGTSRNAWVTSSLTLEQLTSIRNQINAILDKIEEKKEPETFKISLGFALEKTTRGIVEFMSDIGFNLWCLNEGFCSRDDIIEVDVDILKKHGIL